MKYCNGCQYYEPIARYKYEMQDPKMRKCKNYSICNRIKKLIEKEQVRQVSFLQMIEGD